MRDFDKREVSRKLQKKAGMKVREKKNKLHLELLKKHQNEEVMERRDQA